MVNDIGVRVKRQWALAPLSIIVILFGWKYPILGFMVPIVILMGLIYSFSNGRYVCGNLCPRGAFYDRVLSKISPKRKIPLFLKSMGFRVGIIFLFCVVFSVKISQDPFNWRHWGHVFWFMCTVTTIIGIILGIFIHHRAWCSFCPSGTLENLIGGHKNPIKIDYSSCAGCKKCERSCTMTLTIIGDKSTPHLTDRDCIKCGECISACKKNTLSF